MNVSGGVHAYIFCTFHFFFEPLTCSNFKNMITKIRFQWGLHCSPNESPAYYHFQIIQDIKLNPRQIWCSYLFASVYTLRLMLICVHFATQILERERFMIYSVFSDRTIGNHWSENRILRNFGKGKYLVFLPPLPDNQVCF